MNKVCRVSFKDLTGVVHAAAVHAETPYEAAALGLAALKRSDWVEVIGPSTRIVIQVLEPPAEHFMMFAQLTRWLDGTPASTAELVRKKRLKTLLAS